ALHVVGELIERHLGGHLWQLFREKVRCSHPALHRTERMLRCLTADTHCIGVVIEPILNSLQNGLVFPSRDAPLAASRALGLERTALASGRPITAQCLTILLACESVGEPFAGR